MKTGWKILAGGAIATAVLGEQLMGSLGVSLGSGGGSFIGVVTEDAVPAFTDGIRNYDGGGKEGLFGEQPSAPAPPLGAAPGGPANPG
jgi:hypothetical protein